MAKHGNLILNGLLAIILAEKRTRDVNGRLYEILYGEAWIRGKDSKEC